MSVPGSDRPVAHRTIPPLSPSPGQMCPRPRPTNIRLPEHAEYMSHAAQGPRVRWHPDSSVPHRIHSQYTRSEQQRNRERNWHPGSQRAARRGLAKLRKADCSRAKRENRYLQTPRKKVTSEFAMTAASSGVAKPQPVSSPRLASRAYRIPEIRA